MHSTPVYIRSAVGRGSTRRVLALAERNGLETTLARPLKGDRETPRTGEGREDLAAGDGCEQSVLSGTGDYGTVLETLRRGLRNNGSEDEENASNMGRQNQFQIETDVKRG